MSKHLVLPLILILSSFLACSGGPGIDYSTPENLEELASSGQTYHLIDVRAASEYEGGHIPTAVNIPYTEIGTGIQTLTEDRAALILVYCASGRRSGMAYQTLVDAGYTNVRDLGGISAWTGPTVTGPEPGTF